MKHEDFTEKQISSKSIFEGRILHVFDDKIALPDGNEASREYIRHVGACCVVPITDDGKVIMERQYRYPVGEVTFEIPAGKLNSKDEDPCLAAARELREETGATASELTYMGYCYPVSAYSDEKIHMFMARGLTFGDSEPDDDEFLSVEYVPIKELVDDILGGEIHDLKTQAAVLRAYLMLQRENG